jgi:hypothetical protein
MENNTFSMGNMKREISENGKGFLLHIKNFKGTLTVAEANLLTSISTDLSVKLNCTIGKVKLILINTYKKIITLREISFDNIDAELQRINITLGRGINRLKLISDNGGDITLEFKQPEAIFKYNEKFPFAPLFKDQNLVNDKETKLLEEDDYHGR